MKTRDLVQYWILVFAAFINASALAFAHWEGKEFYSQAEVNLALVVLTISMSAIIIRIAQILLHDYSEDSR